MKCLSCNRSIKKNDKKCRFCEAENSNFKNNNNTNNKEPKVVNHIVYQIVESKTNNYLSLAVFLLSFITILETSLFGYYFFVINDNNDKDGIVADLVSINLPNKLIKDLNSYFSTDDFEVSVSRFYKFDKINNSFSSYNGRDVVVVPVSVSNLSDKVNSFNIFNYRIYGPDNNEVDEVAGYFENSLFYSKNYDPYEKSVKYLYFLYEKNGTYKIVFNDEIVVKLFVQKDSEFFEKK